MLFTRKSAQTSLNIQYIRKCANPFSIYQIIWIRVWSIQYRLIIIWIIRFLCIKASQNYFYCDPNSVVYIEELILQSIVIKLIYAFIFSFLFRYHMTPKNNLNIRVDNIAFTYMKRNDHFESYFLYSIQIFMNSKNDFSLNSVFV